MKKKWLTIDYSNCDRFMTIVKILIRCDKDSKKIENEQKEKLFKNLVLIIKLPNNYLIKINFKS